MGLGLVGTANQVVVRAGLFVCSQSRSPLRLERGWRHNSRPVWEHEHLTVNDLIFRKNIRTGFRIYLKFRVGKARLDCLEGLLFIWNGDKK
jgi:hypothetical protein